MNPQAIAKEQFFAYGGDHGQMAKDGVLAEYQSCAITPETEAAWLQELIASLSEAFSQRLVVDDATLPFLHIIRRCSLLDELRKLVSTSLQHANRIDGLSRILIAESIADYGPTVPPDIVNDALRLLASSPAALPAAPDRQPAHLALFLTPEHLAERVARCRRKLRVFECDRP